MSTQSINELSQGRYLKEFDKSLKDMARAYFYKKHFLLGQGVDSDKRNHAMIFHRLLCTDNCEIINYILDKIAGRLKEQPKKKNLSNLITAYKTQTGCVTDENCFKACGISDAEW